MKLALVQINPWDEPVKCRVQDVKLEKYDGVIIETENGLELGEIAGFSTMDEADLEKEGAQENIFNISRKANSSDYNKLPSKIEKKSALKICQKNIEKHGLEMKLVDASYAYDGSRITFAFVAEGRVDFRELVKDLTRHFNKSIRLHQVGIRDEAKISGDCGHCGRQLCCKKFLKDLVSITSEMAEVQQCVHRGSDRLSGICGRLMCCLAYEEEGYREMFEKMPAIGAKVNVDGRRGLVVGHHMLKQTVDVEFDAEKGESVNGSDKVVVEVDLNRNKK